METITDFIFLGYKITTDDDFRQEIKRHLLLEIKAKQHIKKQRHHFADKGPSNQSYGFSSSHVWMLELDYKERKKESEVSQSCPTLCDPMDCSLPGSSLHGILQARVLEWVAISFSRASFPPRDRTWVSHIPGRCFNL